MGGRSTASVFSRDGRLLPSIYADARYIDAVVVSKAADDIIAALKGPFEPYTCFADVPRALRAAPDAKTWAGVQLWHWWLPPTCFGKHGAADGRDDDGRAVCKSRVATVWSTMLSGLHAEQSAALPHLPEELWLHMFGFLKHDQPPTFKGAG